MSIESDIQGLRNAPLKPDEAIKLLNITGVGIAVLEPVRDDGNEIVNFLITYNYLYYINKAFLEILGYYENSVEEITGKDLIELYNGKEDFLKKYMVW